MKAIETELRMEKRNWQNIQKFFIWYVLSVDFMRQLVAKRWDYRDRLERELLMDMHGYSVHPSMFYNNMYHYIKNGLAYTKDLKYYQERIYMLYIEQAEKELNASTTIHRIVDGTGRILDQIIY